MKVFALGGYRSTGTIVKTAEFFKLTPELLNNLPPKPKPKKKKGV
jgi:hypothetical protein